MLEGDSMKCFNCGFLCTTKYHTEVCIDFNRVCITNPTGAYDKIIAVSKFCNMCQWESHPTKIPESI